MCEASVEGGSGVSVRRFGWGVCMCEASVGGGSRVSARRFGWGAADA